MSSLFNNVRWSAAAQVSRVGGQLISLAVLSRLLPPSDYGVMAMAGVVTALAGMLRDMGTGAAIIQRKELSVELTNTVFWMNLALGFTLATFLVLGSESIGKFFQEPQLPGVLMALAALFPVSSATAVHQALIERRSGFKTLATMDVVIQLTGLVLAIIAALAGAGVYSFVVPTAVSALIGSVWLWHQSKFRPQWVWSASEFKGIWGFSGNLTAFNFINYFARNADSIIIGRLLGAVDLGHYTMAYKIMLFPVQNLSWVISRVLLPKFSELQNDPSRTREIYFLVLGNILNISAPLMMGLWVLREPFVIVVFGPKWDAVISVLAWLAPVGLLQSMMSTVGTLFTAKAQTRKLMWMGIINTSAYIVSFLIGSNFGLVGVAAAYFIANIISFVVVVAMTQTLLESRLSDMTVHIWPPIASALIMACGIAIFMWAAQVASTAPFLILLAGASVGAAIYLIALHKLFGRSILNKPK